MTTQKKWLISLSDKSYIRVNAEGQSRIFVIGYENGMRKRKEEIYFSQREKDSDFYLMQFSPEPYYISYSFFNGLFMDTIEKISATISENEPYLTRKRAVLDRFFSKYVFRFSENPEMDELVKDYADAMVENLVDIHEKVNGNGN